MIAAWRVEKIPIFENNFVFVIHNQSEAIVVDPGEASATLAFLESRTLTCRMILVTHHHNDHIGGVLEIKNKYLCPVYAPNKNKTQLQNLEPLWLQEGDLVSYQDLNFKVWEMPGHTLGHIAYWNAEKEWIFSGDVLFSLGCGRLFEGTFEEAFKTLQRFKDLPSKSQIFCTHDYYPNNLKFCQQEQRGLAGYHSQMPLVLSEELKFNPFLLAADALQFKILREKRNLL